ncbi:MAG: enolase C-terminal domain-like protein, partial [Pseudomonadota bacterium]
KLGGPDDAACIKAIRAARPDAHLILDANCGWTFEGLREITPALADAGVEMIEQPLPPGEDDALNGYESPIPICADESCQTEASLAQLPSAYGMINIKLDKAGGLTAAYRLAAAARRRGLAVMVGNMLGSSLAMAPAFLLAQTSAYADLDGPIYLTEDCAHAMRYANGAVEPPRSELWG